jgi:prepilin-type processing-associated H-X9-DG protein
VNNAAGKNGTIGHSYEIAGFLNSVGGPVANTRKTQSVTAGYTYKLNLAALPAFSQYNCYGQRGGPSDLWIIYDADDRDAADPSRQNEDYPDRGDNHGDAGGNIIFCDGHAEWVTRKHYLRSFFRGTDESKSPIIP